MKKYNRVEIFKKMWRLVKNCNLSMSEALTKAWKMAKLEPLEAELFELNQKDLNGGKTNAVAQMMIMENNRRIDELHRQIAALKAEIYPTVTVTETVTKNTMTEAEKAAMTKRMNEAKEIMETAKNYRDKLGFETMYNSLKKQLADSNKVEVYTFERLDVNAYDAA